MKNIKKIALILISLTLLIACSNEKADKSPDLQATKQTNNGVNKIDFKEVNIQDVKPSIKSIFESKKNSKGYFRVKDEEGYWYIGVFSGKKNTGGYTIKLVSLEAIEDKTVIVVQETSPKPSVNVIQALTYPYTVIRVKGTTQSILVKNTLGEEFKDINNSGEVR